MELSHYIDHTLLKAEARNEDIEKICQEAIKYNFYSVCINPYWVEYCKKILAHFDVKICTVIGFPLGNITTKAKAFETAEAIKNGADEIDMVMNIGLAKMGRWKAIEKEIRTIVEAANNHVVKVIIETGLLTTEEKKRACLAVKQGGADFVKTSTGFLSTGATVEDISLMKSIVKDDVRIKASGGIQNSDQAISMILAGASRIGTSHGVNMITS